MRIILSQKGAGMVLFVSSVVMLLGITALVLDVGLSIYEKEKLSVAVDAASLAATQNLDKSNDVVINTAKQFAALNGVEPSKVITTIAPDRKSVKVETDKEVQYYFAKILGINEGRVTANSSAKAAPLTSYRGVRPLAIVDQELEFNKLYVLKEDAGDGLSGNYGPLALGGDGASTYRNNLLYGYTTTVRVGDTVYTQTGNITQATRSGIDYLIGSDPYSTYYNVSQDSLRIITIMIVDTLDLSGKKPIKVLGFASFYLEGLSGSGGHTEIVGRFIRHVAEGDSSDAQTDYGLRGVKLIN